MEKLLIMSNLTFCHNVFKSRLLQMRQNASAGGKGLTFDCKCQLMGFSQCEDACTSSMCCVKKERNTFAANIHTAATRLSQDYNHLAFNQNVS